MTWLARCTGLSYVNRQIRRGREQELHSITNSNRNDESLSWTEKTMKPGLQVSTTHNMLGEDGVQKIFGDPPTWLRGAVDDGFDVESIGEF